VKGKQRCHLDPDWHGMTYGDHCENRRARALQNVSKNDVLLFWGLLWKTKKNGSDIWETREKGWYLLGALRVELILKGGESTKQLPKALRDRASKNAHVWKGAVLKDGCQRVFVGNSRHSRRFSHPVDMEIGNDKGLLRRSIKATGGRLLQWDKSPRWNSALRSCRAVLETNEAAAKYLARRIAKENPGLNLIG